MDDGGLVDGRGGCVVNRGSVVDWGSVVDRGVVHRGVVDNRGVVDDGSVVDNGSLVCRGLDGRGNVLRVLCLAIVRHLSHVSFLE